MNIWVLAFVIHLTAGGYATLMSPGYWETKMNCNAALDKAWAHKDELQAVAAQCFHIKIEP